MTIARVLSGHYIDIVTGEGLGAMSMKFQLAPFTLIGATTRAGLLDNPFRDRFGIQERLQFYDQEALKTILVRSAKLLELETDPEGAEEIARVFFCTMVGKRIVMLHSFVKKANKTPIRELEIAESRLKEIKHANS